MHFCYSPAKIIYAVGYESREKLKNLLRPDKMPISARFIANRASYQFKRREIDTLLGKLREVTEQ